MSCISTPKKYIFMVYFFQQHALATVASIIMPALLPSNMILLEQGPHFIHGDT